MHLERSKSFFDEYKTSIPLVVLGGTEYSTDIYNEVYGTSDDSDPYLMAPTFYITDIGFGFTSGSYVLQPYAAGIIDFNFTTSEFGDALEGNIL